MNCTIWSPYLYQVLFSCSKLFIYLLEDLYISLRQFSSFERSPVLLNLSVNQIWFSKVEFFLLHTLLFLRMRANFPFLFNLSLSETVSEVQSIFHYVEDGSMSFGKIHCSFECFWSHFWKFWHQIISKLLSSGRKSWKTKYQVLVMRAGKDLNTAVQDNVFYLF
jgi:hypothetical protein